MSSAGAPTLLFAVHSAKPAGAQLVALGQARALRRDHRLVVAIGHGPLRPAFAELGPVVRAPTRVPLWGAPPARWALELARAAPDAVRLAAVARSCGARAIVTNSTVLVAPVLAARLAGLPVLVQAHEAPRTPAARALFAFHGAAATTVVAISRWLAEAFGRTRARLVTSPVGIAVPPWHGPVERRPGPLRLVVVGTLDRHKRQHDAIAALAVLARGAVDAELTLIGPAPDAEYAGELRRAAERAGVGGRVVHAGQCDDVASRLRRADVLLLPGGEVTPLVLMEAMAGGTPVVAARMGSIPDVVDDASGLLVPPGDPGAMAAAVRRLAEAPALADALARAARRRVEAQFDERASHARLTAEVDRLLAR